MVKGGSAQTSPVQVPAAGQSKYRTPMSVGSRHCLKAVYDAVDQVS